MKLKAAAVSVVFFCLIVSAQGQQVQPANPSASYDAATGMAYDISRIAGSVQTMTKTLKDFVDKFAKVEGVALSERQAKMVVGMQLLVQAEQRSAVFQRQQVELVEKESSLRNRIAQIDIDLDQQAIDRSVAFEGSTRTPEVRETRRRTLVAERASLNTVLQQLQSTIQDVAYNLREAQSLVLRLRRTFLPQVERELAEPF